MKADQAILDRLDAPTKAPNWPVGAEGQFLHVYYCTGLCMAIWVAHASYFFTSGFLAPFLFIDKEKLPLIYIPLSKRTTVTERSSYEIIH